MTTSLVIGFDSAWTGNNSGAVVGVLRQNDGYYKPLGIPQVADFEQASKQINDWQKECRPTNTLILIDQPTIVKNETGQRPVENIVSSPVGKRYGGVQPANRGRDDMFGNNAPIWQFLKEHHAVLDPARFAQSESATWIVETYPVLALIAMGWLLPDCRFGGRLPKYNPDNPATFSIAAWKFVCENASSEISYFKLRQLAVWLCEAAANSRPIKADQDRVDACICLLVGLYMVEGKDLIMVGQMGSGYMVVPHGERLYKELENRCNKTKREPLDWLRKFNIR